MFQTTFAGVVMMSPHQILHS